MKRNVLFLLGLFVMAIATSGCCSGPGCGLNGGGHGMAIPQVGYQQPMIQQPILGGGFQQQSGLPSVQVTQESLGRFGRNLGSRISNGIINRGVNHLINGVFGGF